VSASDEERARPSAYDIYERVLSDAEAELERPASGLAFSALFAGLTIGLSGLAAASAFAAIPPGAAGREFVAFALYPIGFIAVVVGRAQFFTENTLYQIGRASCRERV